MDSDTVLHVEKLTVRFDLGRAVNHALTDVGFSLRRGSILGVVGESGSGKSISARAVMQLVTRPGRITGGTVRLRSRKLGGGEPVDVLSLGATSPSMRSLRGGVMAMVFQEPMSAMSMVHTIGQHMRRPVEIHLGLKGQANRDHCIEVLRSVRMPDPEERIDSYPFQLSGGLRQRAMIALALCCEPEILIADEPTTALDVTTQAQILDLVRTIREERQTSVIFITHDLGVVAELCDEMAVMYLGEIVERGTVREVFKSPRHPYTQALLQSMPRLGMGRRQVLEPIRGSIPDPLARPPGCTFHSRCVRAVGGICETQAPPAVVTAEGRFVRCIHASDMR